MSGIRRFETILLGCWVFSVGGWAADADRVVDAPPVLVSTTGGAGAKWATAEELIAAAGRGDPLACHQYAQLLEEGSPANQVPKDGAKAVAFYDKAAAAGHGPALFRLGKIYADGLAGVTPDYPRAFDYYLKAARRGIAEGQYNVGAMLVSARGGKRDYVEGLAWLLVAKKHGADAGAGIEQVRKRLERAPQRIIAAETRAAQLEQELGATPPPATKPAPAAPAAPKKAEVKGIQPTNTPAVPVVAPTIKPPALELPPPPAETSRKDG